jgi:hypothetical protein
MQPLNAAKQKHGEPACGDGQTSSFPLDEVEQEWERLKESGKITPEVWADYVASHSRWKRLQPEQLHAKTGRFVALYQRKSLASPDSMAA